MSFTGLFKGREDLKPEISRLRLRLRRATGDQKSEAKTIHTPS
jgi:hypothetical protein